MRRKRALYALALILSLVVVGAGLSYVLIPKLGYCFGAAFSPGGERLYVAAGYKGLHTFDVSQEGVITYVSLVNDGGYYRYVEAAQDKVYVANSKRGLMVYTAHASELELLWSQKDSRALGVHLQDDLAFVAAGLEGFAIFDLSTPEAPQKVGHLATGGRPWDVWVDGPLAYLADPDKGLLVVDVSTPSEPFIVGRLTWDPEAPSAEILEGRGQVVYVASGKHGLLVVDVSDPTNPEIVWRYNPSTDTFGESVTLLDQTLYVTMVDGAHAGLNGLHVFDIGNPTEPVLLEVLPIRDWVEDVTLAQDHMAIANTHSGIIVLDVRHPGAPKLLDTYPTPFWRFFARTLRW
jgi:hypothetical protein